MFECRACVSRGLRAIFRDAAPATPIARQRHGLLLTPHLDSSPFRREASTAVAAKVIEEDETVSETELSKGDAFGEIETKRSKGLSGKDEKALRTELRYLSDPLKLAEHVRYTLRCNKPEKALDLCRLASKQQEVIVSWNHCIDWHMSHNKIDEGIRIYNEMKKRAQFPDSYTYVLLLRGLARPHHHGEVVKQANVVKGLSIYNSMSSPTSRVKPSIYHTNAVLKVCSAALDMDALWTVAAKLPSRGHGAPDHITYAILLNAIRHGAVGDNPEGAQLDQIASRRQEAVNQGRRIWQEIIPKWRAGEVHIDEELVCAMGRLLLISKRMQDLDDVFSLVQQTMNIERQVAPLGSAERHTEHIPPEISSPGSAEESPEDVEGYRDAPSNKAFNSVMPLPSDASQYGKAKNLAYVKPGNPALSMLIGTCTALRTPKTANAYWDLLTSPSGPYSLQPDLPNFHAQFRLLGINRSSAKAVQVLRKMPENNVLPTNMTFRIVMSTCVRDKNNRNALQHAGVVVDEMEKHCAEPDMHTLIQYLHLALNTNDGPKLATALGHLEPVLQKLRTKSNLDADDGLRQTLDAQRQKDVLVFFQAIVGAIDTLAHQKSMPAEEATRWQARRTNFTRDIGRLRENIGQRQHTSDTLGASQHNALARHEVRRSNAPPLKMSKAEFAMRKLKWGEQRTERKERGRQRAIGLRNWDASQAKRARKDATGFADSPMELGMR